METKELRLTEEMRAKLNSSLGFDVKAEFPYVPIDYRNVDNEIPKELWTVFVLTSKDGLEVAQLEDSAGEMLYDDKTKLTRMKLTGGSQRISTLANGIVSVKQYWLEDGSYFNYNKKRKELVRVLEDGRTETTKGVVARDFIKYMSADLQVEVQNAINERKKLSEEELRGLEY